MLALYEYNINKYFTNLLDVTGKLPVWSDHNFTASTTVANTRQVSALIGSIMIGTCVYLAFFLAWFKFTFTLATDLGGYLISIFDVNPGHD